MWLLAFAVGFSCVYSVDMFQYQSSNSDPSDLAEVSYNAFSRLAWSLALGWLIFACVHGYAGKNWPEYCYKRT